MTMRRSGWRGDEEESKFTQNMRKNRKLTGALGRTKSSTWTNTLLIILIILWIFIMLVILFFY